MSAIRARLLPLIEVIILFVAASLLFRSISASPLHSWESEQLDSESYYAIEYAAVIILVIGFLALSRRSASNNGLSLAQPG